MQDVHEQKFEIVHVWQGVSHIFVMASTIFLIGNKLYIYFMRFYGMNWFDNINITMRQSQNQVQFKNQVEINKNLKVGQLITQKTGVKTVWIFQHSLYEVHIIDVSLPYPHHKICLQHPLQYFDIIQCPNHIYLVVVDNVGRWVAYDIQMETKSKSLVITQISQSMLESIEHKIIGIHLISQDKMMVLFIKQTGKLEYNYLNTHHNTMKTSRMNKLYSIEPQNHKYRSSNLFSKYRGRSLVQTEADNENKILHSAYSLLTNQLYATTQDINSKVCSIFRFFLQDYEVIAGSDILLNLDSRPVQMLLIDRIAVVNLGTCMVVWGRNLAEVHKFGEEGLCTSLTQLDKNTLMSCITKVNQSCIYSITITPNSKQSKTLCTIKQQKIHTIPQQILHYSAAQPPKPHPSLYLTTKLQIIASDKDNSQRVILSNMSATIIRAKMYSDRFSNYLDVVKKVGYNIQRKIVSSNRVVVGVDEYQHNMLVKMSNIASYGVKGQNALLCLSSPIIGTIKLSVIFNNQINKKQKTAQPQSAVSISIAIMQQNLSTQEESLYLNTQKVQQITPTKLSLPKSRYSISDMFEGKIDFILSACIVGNYVLMAVEKQVHVFTIEPKPKRLHIYCLDAQLRMLISLNDVSVWGALLWDGTLLVFRIDQKQSIKIKQINEIGLVNNQNYLQYNTIINTAPYKSTILGHHILICSNDPLHIYQSDKTSIKCLPLPYSIGEQYYPLLQIPSSASSSQSKSNQNNAQKYKILCNKQNIWAIVSFPLKCLVKDIEEIKIQVEVILGFPNAEGLIAGVIKENTMALLSGSKIIICKLQTGSIVYRSVSTFQSLLPQSTKINSNQYLQRWVENQQVSVETLQLETENSILSTNPLIIKLNQSRILLYNRKQIWYASITSNPTQKLKGVKLISYFSIPNDAFIQFRNNLSISELENDAFMEIFAQKLPILQVSMINPILFAVLYSKMIVIVEIKNNGTMAIKQQLIFSEYPEIIGIRHFVGVYDELSLYMKDSSQRLILLKWDKTTNKYKLEIMEEVEDEIVSIFRVREWKESSRKIDFKKEVKSSEEEEIVIRKDGQLIKNRENSQTYL